MSSYSLVTSIPFHFGLALTVRIAFTLYGICHDARVDSLAHHQVASSTMPKYTDIDYQVFTDASRYVYAGQSPYMRDTYRYTPLLAQLLLPNIFLAECFGKLLFVLFDIACGYLILRINETQRAARTTQLAAICFWFYNPITVAISSRGNAESLMAFLVLACVLAMKSGRFALAGFFYGFSVHFKIYPVTYLLAICLFMTDYHDITTTRRQSFAKAMFGLVRALLFNAKLVTFAFSSLTTFVALTSVFYFMYGYEFLNETYLYHLSRQDIRHNFSPYFYMLYLTELTWHGSLVLRLFNFLPQLSLLVVFSAYLNKHIELCLFLITFSFVTFNKVCTSQYFVWYLSLIPIILPKLKISVKQGSLYFTLWMLAQAAWLYFAYHLEFNASNTFFELWLASMLFACVNCMICKFCFLDNYDLRATNHVKKE